jgi:predicted nucleic acid-binding protein
VASRETLLYWDACIFIAWLKNEKRKEGDMAGLNSAVVDLQRGRATVLTSVVTRTEIRQIAITRDHLKTFEGLFDGGPKFRSVDVTPAIADLAGQIRLHYLQQSKRDGRPPLQLPDALHIATALIHEAAVLHTFDEADNKKNKSRGLISLNGEEVAGYRLRIEKPSSLDGQTSLDLRPERELSEAEAEDAEGE